MPTTRRKNPPHTEDFVDHLQTPCNDADELPKAFGRRKRGVAHLGDAKSLESVSQTSSNKRQKRITKAGEDPRSPKASTSLIKSPSTKVRKASPKSKRSPASLKQATQKVEEDSDVERSLSVPVTAETRETPKKSTPEKSKKTAPSNKASPGRRKTQPEVKEEDPKSEQESRLQEADETDTKKPAVRRKRKTQEEKDAEAMPLAARTSNTLMKIGAHVSCAKGIQNSVTHANHIGGNAFAMFLKSQRKWDNPPLQDDHRDQFKQRCKEHSYDAASHVLPHGSYLVNLAQEDADKAQQAYNSFLDDLKRCDMLGIKLYNFHPGWTGSAPRPKAIVRIANSLNRAIAATTAVVPVLEAMAGAGNVIGSTFEDLRDIIALVDDKDRIGVCIDTCHIFAAGYDLRTPEAFAKTITKFDSIVGMQYLRALHLNDSKAPLASHRDLHQNIGHGFLGLRAFHNVMNEKRFENLPMVLETPIDHKDENGKEVEDKGVYAREIKLLESLIGMDAEGAAFCRLEKDLAEKGAEERAKYQEAFERKKEKDSKKEQGQTKLKFGSRKTKAELDDSDGR